MIGSLRGTIIDISPVSALLEVQGIGYRIQAPSGTLAGLRMNEETQLFIHDHVREDAHDLYGFVSKEDLGLFERLINISGVGPKAGLSILSLGTAETVKRAIMNGDLATLTSVSGIGKKIAQKVILELKGQLVEDSDASPADREVSDALVSLGYSASQARDAIKSIPAEITDVSDRVREALKNLSSR